MKSILGKVLKIRKEEKGGVLVLVALCILPLTLMLGLAVDTAYGLAMKRKLQFAVDAAAKAGAMNGGGQLATITTEAQKVFTSNTVNMPNITGPTVTYATNTGIITVSACITVPTLFMKVGGIPSMTYCATASATLAGYSEVAIVVDMTPTTGQWTAKMLNSLQSFVSGLPPSVMISVVPMASQVLLDRSTTNPGSLFNHLSPTTNDESADPALYPLSSNYSWNLTNYGNVYNMLYGNTFPTSTSYYPLPGKCTGWGGPGTYLACSAFYPSLCAAGRPSCRTNYSYKNYNIPAILPLTLNRSIISNYITTLGNFNTVDTGLFTSLMVWGWRALAPEWSDVWLVNRNPSDASRISGPFPSAYNQANVKSVILVVTGRPKWGFQPVLNNYTSACGQGKTKWFMTAYGAVPMTSEKSSYVDITCDNYNYNTIDKSLGLNLSPKSYYDPNHTGPTYAANVVTEIAAKYQRICSNMKAKGINIFVITQVDDSILKSCATSPNAPYYQVTGNGVPHIDSSFVTSSNYISGLVAIQR